VSDSAAETFFAWALPATRALQHRYHLDAWRIRLEVVSDKSLHPRNAAEVAIREEYRTATIYLSKSLVLEADRDTVLHVIDHELQHVVLHPLDALRSLVLDIIPDALRGVVTNEFGRTNERVRAALERLLTEQAAPALRDEAPALLGCDKELAAE
jgi:hypothetical protein